MTLILSGTDGLSDVDGSAATPAIRGTDANTGIFFPAADTIAFAEGGAEAMRIDSSGNVGIGTSSPAVNLNVAKASDGVAARFQRSSGGGLVDIETYNGIGGIGTSDNIPFRLNTNNTERMRIDASGNVGIGTTSPGDILHIQSSTGNNVVRIQASTTGTNTIQMGDTSSSGAGYVQYANNGDYMRFATNAAERMRIDSSGNVGIGTSSPATKLHVSGNMTLADYGNIGATNNNAGISLTGGNTTNNGGQINLRGGSFGTANAIEFIQGGTEQARIDTGGVFKFNSGYGSVATAYGCRAWVNFNGTGTVAIRASGNVSSITDNGTGNYTVNFSTAMPDTNYSAVGTCGSPSVAHGVVMFVVGTGTVTGTGGVQFATTSLGAAQFDYTLVCLAVFR